MQENDNINVQNINNGTHTAKRSRSKEPRAAQATVDRPMAAKKQAYMYLGPNIPGGRLFGGNLFKCDSCDEITHMEDLFENLPSVRKLFVEVKKVPDFKRQLQEQGTRESGLYQQAQMEIADAIKEGAFENGI